LPGFENQVLWCGNQCFSDPTATQFHHLGEFTTGGNLAIGTGAAAPAQQIAVGQLTGSGGIVISYVNPNINIDGSGAGGSIVWNNISVSQTMSVQNGYFCSGGGAIVLLLPPTSVFGDLLEIVIDGSASVSIHQGAGQTIKLANAITTAGVGGSLTSTQQGDSIRLLCKTPNLAWTALSADGSWTIV